MNTNLRRIGTAVSLLILSACSSESTTAPIAAERAPKAEAPSADLLGASGRLNGTLNLVAGARRNTPLPAAITTSATIGAAGGTLSIPAAGVTVTVPAGAVSSPVVFTMTARAGSLLAYDFAPHGITFAKPLVFKQNLVGTNVSLLTANLLKLGYYSDPSLLTSAGGAVSELIAGAVNLTNWTFTSSIQHFSGYMVACGRGGDDD